MPRAWAPRSTGRRGPEHTYTLVAFAHDLDPALRSDRVIAEAWDATFALYDGEPSEDDIARLFQNVPKQEAGRVSGRELVLSRANRSVRLFSHVIDSLAAGRQPDRDKVEAVGYLMRTTAVYGSGKFGTADREAICDRAELAGPFRAEMLTVWLIRAFTLDLVEHMARENSPDTAVPLEPALRRRFGVGNSTGLGMAPFLMTHPALINNWMTAREEALARVRALPASTAETRREFNRFLARARQNAEEWNSPHEIQVEKVAALRADLKDLAAQVARDGLTGDHPWDWLYRWSEEALSLEGQEQLVSLLIEPHGELVDGLAQCMDADEAASFPIDGAMTLGRLKAILEDAYGWALGVDYGQKDTSARFWYVSEEKLEPRVGERYEEPGADYEQPLAIGRDIAALAGDLRRLGYGRAGRRLPAAPSRAPPRGAPRPARPASPLRRDPRQPDRRRNAADRPLALQAVVLRRDQVRSALGPLGAYHHVSGRALPRRAGGGAGRRLGLSPSTRGEPMIYALNEIEATSRKAARGAGFAWGLAEEIGKSVRALAAYGLPGPDVLLAHLRASDRQAYGNWAPVSVEGTWQAKGGLLCPLIAGITLCDHNVRLTERQGFDLGPTAFPLLLAPFVLRAAAGRPLALRWQGVEISCLAGRTTVEGAPEDLRAPRAAWVTCAVGPAPTEGIAPSRHGREVPSDVWHGLGRFAQRTYVPASEASRLAGAGAGTSDND